MIKYHKGDFAGHCSINICIDGDVRTNISHCSPPPCLDFKMKMRVLHTSSGVCLMKHKSSVSYRRGVIKPNAEFHFPMEIQNLSLQVWLKFPKYHTCVDFSFGRVYVLTKYHSYVDFFLWKGTCTYKIPYLCGLFFWKGTCTCTCRIEGRYLGAIYISLHRY